MPLGNDEFLIKIPEDSLDRAIDGMAYGNNYDDNILDENGDSIPNPVSKRDFVKELIAKYIENTVKSYEVGKAREDAAKAEIEENHFPDVDVT